MALKGRLEDLSLLDILQVVAFSKKTGQLKVAGDFGQGAVLFKDGLIISACSPTTVEVLSRLGKQVGVGSQKDLILEQIQIALQELSALGEGSFEFELTSGAPSQLGNIDLRSFSLQDGVDAQWLLLSLAKDMDDERRANSEMLESAFYPEEEEEAPEDEHAEHPETPTIVLVDDEDAVLRVVSADLSRQGYTVTPASGPAEGVAAVHELLESQKSIVLITDLRMPTTNGASFYGGFELVRMLRRDGIRIPILLMTDKWTPKVKARAKKLGVRQVAFKSALSKLDSEQYGEDLRSFAASLRNQLGEMIQASVDSSDGAGHDAEDRNAYLLEFLTTMTERLTNPDNQGEISRMVLRVASKYVERGLLLLVKRNGARGLGGFGLADTSRASFTVAQQITIDINQADPMAEVVHSRATRRFHDSSGLEQCLYSTIGRGRAKEFILIPILNKREVLAVLYLDNHATGKPLGKLPGLELFIAQAGMALENLSLHRKLEMFQSKLFPEKENAR
jgi:CheY-like chemotaxis protein